MEPRLASSVLVSALLRRAESEGGFGAVLARGDSTAGAIGVILTQRSESPRFFERLLLPDGSYGWRESHQTFENEDDLKKFLEKRRRFDTDMWILELDIASTERFAAEMNSVG